MKRTKVAEIWICPYCGAKMKRMTNCWTPSYTCPDCGCSLEEKEQNFDTERFCPNCHQPLGEENECSYCGYDLGSDFD